MIYNQELYRNHVLEMRGSRILVVHQGEVYHVCDSLEAARNWVDERIRITKAEVKDA